jgi:hypothetical protein
VVVAKATARANGGRCDECRAGAGGGNEGRTGAQDWPPRERTTRDRRNETDQSQSKLDLRFDTRGACGKVTLFLCTSRRNDWRKLPELHSSPFLFRFSMCSTLLASWLLADGNSDYLGITLLYINSQRVFFGSFLRRRDARGKSQVQVRSGSDG